MQLGCVDTANGYGSCKKMYYFYHKKPSRYQCVFIAAISTVYLLRTCDNARLHTGWSHSPTKAQHHGKLFIQYIDQRTKHRSECWSKGWRRDPFLYERTGSCSAFWELLLPSPMCLVIAVVCQVLETALALFGCYSFCQKILAKQWW